MRACKCVSVHTHEHAQSTHITYDINGSLHLQQVLSWHECHLAVPWQSMMHLCLVCVSFALCTEHCFCFRAVRGLSRHCSTLIYRVFRNRKPPAHPWVFFAVILCYTGTANIFFPADTYLNFDQRSLRETPAGLTGRVSASGCLIHTPPHPPTQSVKPLQPSYRLHAVVLTASEARSHLSGFCLENAFARGKLNLGQPCRRHTASRQPCRKHTASRLEPGHVWPGFVNIKILLCLSFPCTPVCAEPCSTRVIWISVDKE